MENFKQFSLKEFGYFDFTGRLPENLGRRSLSEFIKIVFLKAGGTAVIDFKTHEVKQDTLFFINAAQYHQFADHCTGTAIYYNQDFYCVELHDAEVACDGILFHNIYEIPMVMLSVQDAIEMQRIITAIKGEFDADQSSMEDMLRVFLKQLIISATRIFKRDRATKADDARHDFEFSRYFSQLVENNFRKLHTVSEYADMLNITPKALNRRITQLSEKSPNDVIKDRIILEGKRLLAHTRCSVKEIGYKLGYDDTSYFIRMFSAHAQRSPQQFRQLYHSGE
jgi:AraC-like DNA-binding protein